MPYPNEHAARLNDPDKYDSFRRDNDAGGDGIDFIYMVFCLVAELSYRLFDSIKTSTLRLKQRLG